MGDNIIYGRLVLIYHNNDLSYLVIFQVSQDFGSFAPNSFSLPGVLFKMNKNILIAL